MRPDSEQKTDHAAFLRHFSEVASRIYAYIFVLVHEHEAANDVFQEVSVALWESYDQFEPGSSFYAWSREIAYRRVLKYRQLRQRDRRLLAEDVLDSLAAVADKSDPADGRLQALAECYGKLTAHDRELLDRRYAARATVESVAEDVGRSLHHVYRSLRRIHRSLQQCIRRALAEGDV